MSLKREWATYQRALPGLLADPANIGQHILIKGDEIAGLYPTFETGMAAGYAKYGLAGFMVQEVVKEIRPVYFSRSVEPCR